MRSVLNILLLFILTNSFAQNQNKIWYFGTNAGIDFNSGIPIVLLDGQIPQTEGCTSICDQNGNLLFYSDGVSVWNKDHQIMSNGSNLYGGGSSTQSVVAVQKPGTSNLYYLFTVNPIYGVHYSELDLNLQGGLGDINANKNIPISYNTIEKLTAVRHQNGVDYWIITHESSNDTFNAHLISSTGVNTTPVVSAVGCRLNSLSEVGYLKASPNGAYLASANYYTDTVQVFNFDNSTGQISNPRSLNNFLQYGVYGLEFSPSNQFLYVSDANDSISKVYQYDLTAPNIENSKILISTLSGYTGALQLAPDGKVYICIAYGLYLDAIDNPNGSGSQCNYSHNSLYLGGQTSFIGLPNYINDVYNFPLNTVEIKKPERKLVKVIDLMGEETEIKSNTLQIYIYSDGSTNKVFRAE